MRDGEMRAETYGGGLACLRLGGELLTGRLATGGLASGLLRAGHCFLCVVVEKCGRVGVLVLVAKAVGWREAEQNRAGYLYKRKRADATGSRVISTRVTAINKIRFDSRDAATGASRIDIRCWGAVLLVPPQFPPALPPHTTLYFDFRRTARELIDFILPPTQTLLEHVRSWKGWQGV